MKKDKEIVKKLEMELLEPEVRRSKKRLNELLSDDFSEFTSKGSIVYKKDILEKLPKEKNIDWKVFNLKIKIISENVILATYKAKKINLKDKSVTLSFRSSIWKNNNSNWKIIFHQGTPLLITNH